MLARAKRDYYAVLGVPRDADREAIKKAFRALAAECHPDVSDDPDAEERFRELAEAYEVLSRPETRRRYDRLGRWRAAGLRPAAGFGRNDFAEQAAMSRRPGQRGADVIVAAELDFLDSVRGITRGLRYSAVAVCEGCRGEGTGPGGLRRACPACEGVGRLREVASAYSGRLFRYRACVRCDGAGVLVTDPCDACGGLGRVVRERTVLVRIPPGARDGQRIRLPGQGHAGGPGGEPGDVEVELRVASPPDSPVFRRLAAAGAACGLALLVVTLVVAH